MVWVFGNSYERVAIKDLNDTIYYRQKKQYSDQEFESSRDLQREIQKGRIIKLEHLPEIKGTIPDTLAGQQGGSAPTVDLREMRRVITEVIGESKTAGVNLKDLVTGLIPVLSGMIREEISKIPGQQLSGQVGMEVQSKVFVGPEYVPEISSKGMKSNISVDGKQVEGAGVSNSLDVLRRMGKA